MEIHQSETEAWEEPQDPERKKRPQESVAGKDCVGNLIRVKMGNTESSGQYQPYICLLKQLLKAGGAKTSEGHILDY